MDIKNLETIHKKLEGYNCKLLAVVKNQKIEDIKKELKQGKNKSNRIIKQHNKIFKMLKNKKGSRSPQQYGY